MMNRELAQAIQDKLPEAFSLVRYLYDHPETAGKEVQSSKVLVEALRQAGFQVEYPFMEKELGYGTAFRAVLENGKGPRAAILVEYDALPEIGHGCGHNLHGPLSILAALGLARCKELFSGTGPWKSSGLRQKRKKERSSIWLQPAFLTGWIWPS